MEDAITYAVLALVAATVLVAAWNGFNDNSDNHGV